VRLDAAPVHRQGRCFDWPALATQDAARVRLLKIPITDLTERHASSNGMALGRRILALRDLGQSLPRDFARRCRGHGTVLAKDQPPRTAFGVSILDKERLDARGLYGNP